MKNVFKSKCFNYVTVIIMLIGFIYLFFVNNNPDAVQNLRKVNENLLKVEYQHNHVPDENSPSGERCIYSFTLNEFEENDVLALYLVHHKAEIKIDDKVVYTNYTEGQPYSLGRYWIFLDLDEEDKGKPIEIYSTPFYRTQISTQVDIFVGKQLSIYKKEIANDLFNIVLCFIVIVVGIALIIFRKLMVNDLFINKSFSFSLFLISLGTLKIINTETFALLKAHPFFFYLSNFLSITNSITFMLYFNRYFSESKRKILNYSYVAFAIFLVVQITVYFFGVKNMIDVIIIPNVLMMMNIFVMGYFLTISKESLTYSYNLKVLFMLLAFGGLADLFIYYINNNFNISLCLVAVMIFVILYVSDMVKQSLKQRKELREKEKEVMDSRMELMMSQIRPHFMYNNVGTIYTLCLEDSKKAADVVYDFSQYLRGNFKELERKSLIPLTKEIQHVRHYTNIEQIRFEDIEIIFDLQCTDFMLRALPIQPLVENSIKHGLMGLEDGGYVRISTYETEKDYCVCVEDNGIGFDENVLLENNTNKHLGILNIKGRIEVMCNGRLTIETENGVGTKAIIHLPKEFNRKKEYQDESISRR